MLSSWTSVHFRHERYDRCSQLTFLPSKTKRWDFPFNQLLQIVAAPKSRLSGLLSSGLQACGVSFRSTRRACFLGSIDLGFLVAPFAARGSLGSCQCRVIIFGTAIGGGSGECCGSTATGTMELSTGKRSLFVSVSATVLVLTSGMSLPAATADTCITAVGRAAPKASLNEARPDKPNNRISPSQTVRITTRPTCASNERHYSAYIKAAPLETSVRPPPR